MKQFLALTILLSAFTLAANPCSFIDRDLARWTHADMIGWRTALAAYKADHGRYPAGKTIEEARAAVEPNYIAHAPLVDAWGHAYVYDSAGDDFRIVSAGADGTFERTSWTQAGKNTSYADDGIVTDSGRWLFRYWDLSK